MKNEKFGADFAWSIELKKRDKFFLYGATLTSPFSLRGGEWSNQGLTTTLLNTLLQREENY